jgi:hypothetical protein
MVEPELSEPYPHRDALQKVFMDIQSFFPFFRITNKPRSAFEHFGAISPSRDSKRKNHSLMK